MTWETDASRLAAATTPPGTRWRAVVAGTPRHHLVPAWFERAGDGWVRHSADLRPSAPYDNRSRVTQVGTTHADTARSDAQPTGRATSSATEPALTVRMYTHAALEPEHELLEIGTGSGYSTALACGVLGAHQVTTLDVDPYLTGAAARRLKGLGYEPEIHTRDATGALPGEGRWDRIVSTVAVERVPASWLAALNDRGRLVTTLAGTTLILTADKAADGGARGRIAWDRGGFMEARPGPDYEGGVPAELRDAARHDRGDDLTQSPYPVLDVAQSWDLASMHALAYPGTEHEFGRAARTDHRVAIMMHPDGSWARAESRDGGPTLVHQSGPERLWDIVDDIRDRLHETGELPVRGARATITPDGVLTLSRGDWTHTIG